MGLTPYYEHARVTLHNGDCRAVLAGLPDGSVQTCVTSPPYFGLRSYLDAGHADKGAEVGTEQTPQEYVDGLVAKNHGRAFVGIELNAAYCDLIVDRLRQDVLALAAAV